MTYHAPQIFLGFFLAIGLYNALVFALTRERPFLWYAGIMAGMAAFEFSLEPVPIRTLPPVGQYLYDGLASFVYFGCTVGFARSFLRLPERRPALDRVLLGAFALLAAAIGLEHVLPYTRLHSLAEDVILLGLLGTCMAAGLVTMRSGDAAARYYVLAFAAVMAGIVIEDAGLELHLVLARQQDLWQYFYEFGVALEALSLALALASRVRSASVDPLTGVANRRAFDEALSVAWHAAQTRGTPFALVLVDMDDFKTYNDTRGHAAGDELLRTVAAACMSCTRQGIDTFARFGGDEFAVILTRSSAADGSRIAHRMEEAVRARCGVAISTGVASSQSAAAADVLDLFRAADAALYATKRAHGRSAREPART